MFILPSFSAFHYPTKTYALLMAATFQTTYSVPVSSLPDINVSDHSLSSHLSKMQSEASRMVNSAGSPVTGNASLNLAQPHM